MVWLVFCLCITIASAVVISNNASLVCLGKDPNSGEVFQPCQLRTRLTPSFADLCGAVWTPGMVYVNDSFTIQFSMQVSNITGYCAEHQNVFRFCKSRGGHGLALIIQNDPNMKSLPTFIGQCGNGLGYTGINNSLALELDLWYDPELFDLYDNHVALQSMSNFSNSNDHRNSLAVSSDIADLADGRVHTIKVYYEPRFDINIISPENCTGTHSCGRFQANPVFASMLTTTYSSSLSMGLLWAFIDDLVRPIFITPVNLNDLLSLNQGRAYVGISASTGHFQFQTHDIFNWTICTSSSCNQFI